MDKAPAAPARCAESLRCPRRLCGSFVRRRCAPGAALVFVVRGVCSCSAAPSLARFVRVVAFSAGSAAASLAPLPCRRVRPRPFSRGRAFRPSRSSFRLASPAAAHKVPPPRGDFPRDTAPVRASVGWRLLRWRAGGKRRAALCRGLCRAGFSPVRLCGASRSLLCASVGGVCFSSCSLTGSRSSGGNGHRRRFEVVRFPLAVE